MSHTIGQVEANNQQSNSNSSQGNQNAQKPEDKTSQSVSSLADADYEFLFNQLLEGIAHGWHDQRIIKFFNQLGDRGKQEDWVAWLERLRTRVLELPLQSKRQLGTMMIRLGELTRSTTTVDQIGAASNLIGRELLFGNTEDVIWEYVGSDIPSDFVVMETETELADRLPADFAELGSAVMGNLALNARESTLTPDLGEDISAIETTEDLQNELATASGLNTTAAQIPDPAQNISIGEKASEQHINEEQLDNQQIDIDLPLEDHHPTADFSRTDALGTDIEENSASADTASTSLSALSAEEFEFELSDSPPEVIANQPLDQVLDQSIDLDLSLDLDSDQPEALITDPETPEPKILGKELLNSATRKDPQSIEEDLSLIDQIDQIDQPQTDLASTQTQTQDQSQTQNNNQDAEEINIQQVMSLIQSDPELAQQISHKLNVSALKLDQLTVEQSEAIKANHIEPSGIELIESWFNLGLKQVSTGEFAKAISSWEKALNINPNLSEAWHNRGSALGRLGKYDLAVTSFQNALTIDSQNYQAWNDRAHALYQLEKWEEAVVSWNNALKIMPANHLFWYNRGCGLEQLENWEEAIISYEKSLEIKPDFQPARSRYINLVADDSRTN